MYIYLTTNLINGKIYIGLTKKSWNDTIWYYGSGKYLKEAIKQFKKINFKKELICYCQDETELNKMEKFFIDYYDSTNPEIGYNITKGGQGGCKPCSDETKLKISKIHKGKIVSDETKEKIKKSLIGKHCTEESKEKIRLSHLGKFHTKETKEKIKNSNINKHKSKEHCKNISKSLLGRKLSKEHIQHYKDAWKTRKPDSEYTKKLKTLNNYLHGAKNHNNVEKIAELEEQIRIHKLEKVNE